MKKLIAGTSSGVDEARSLVAAGRFAPALRALQTTAGTWDADEAELVRDLASEIREQSTKRREQRQAKDMMMYAESQIARLLYPLPLGTPAGWYPDPLGSGKARQYISGWTDKVRDDVTPRPLPVVESPPPSNGSHSDTELIVPGETPGTKICPRCAEEVKAAAVVCRFCGHEFNSSSAGSGDSRTEPTTTSGVAIAAFITSLVGLWFASIPLGISAQRTIDRSNGRIGGRGFATAGIVLGIFGIIGTVILIIALIHTANQPGCTYTYNATGACVPGT